MTTEPHIAIAELRIKIDAHSEDIARHDRHLAKLDETVTILRENFARVATKDDIMELRGDIAEKFDRRLADAHNSIPAKFATVLAGGMFLIALITLAITLAHHA